MLGNAASAAVADSYTAAWTPLQVLRNHIRKAVGYPSNRNSRGVTRPNAHPACWDCTETNHLPAHKPHSFPNSGKLAAQWRAGTRN